MNEIVSFGWNVIGLFGAFIGVMFLIGVFGCVVNIGDDIARWLEKRGWN